MFGDDGAVELARAGERIIPAVRALGDDVWLREGGMLMVSTAPTQDGAIDEAVAAAEQLGAPEQAVPLDAEQLAARVSSPVFRRGVFLPEGATVQPARLVRALRRAVVDAGVTLHEGTRATAHLAGVRDDAARPRPRGRDRRRRQRGAPGGARVRRP